MNDKQTDKNIKSTTPAMQQFYSIKEQYPDTIIFFRMGDFYEMFDEDAKIASKILGIALTYRNKSSKNAIPLCGIPYHAYTPYLIKLLKAGKKVAICEQLEDPKMVKGVVKRGVTRVVTPGTSIEDEATPNFDNNFIISLYAELNKVYFVAADVTTGDVFIKTFPIHDINSAISGIDAKEIISNIDIDINNITVTVRKVSKHYHIALNKVLDYYKVGSLKGLFIEDEGYIWAIAMLLDYFDDLILTTKLMLPTTLNDNDHLILDSTTLSTLEINYSPSGQNYSLFSILNKTSTPMGARLLKWNLMRPLRNKDKINKRLNRIEYFIKEPTILSTVSGLLDTIFDIERITSRIVSSRVSPKDLLALKLSLKNIPEINAMLKLSSDIFIDYELDSHKELYDMLDKSISDRPPTLMKEGGIIKDGYNENIDELREIKNNSKAMIESLEERERKATGISKLKIGFNKVFGYYFEVSKINIDKVPDSYTRKQTLVDCERFINEELKELESKILNADNNLFNLEFNVFLEIREYVSKYIDSLRVLARQIAELDIICSNANASLKYDYHKPNIAENNSALIIKEGRHPIVEQKTKEMYVPNDFYLDDSERLFIITGPNMSGKSTYIRTCALICIMAHCGFFVPVEDASIPLFDRVFTRVGASDNLSKGESTFMVEMVETANILKNATKDSLIILDEIGRGTSTYDGISIAWAVAEYILNKIGAKTLFATHYFELTEIGEKATGAINYTVSVEEWDNEVIFLRKVIKGMADKSYGIYVGKMAGLPESVTNRASEILSDLENNEHIEIEEKGKKLNKKNDIKFIQPMLVFDDSHPVLDELKNIDIDNITPMQSLQILGELKKKIGN